MKLLKETYDRVGSISGDVVGGGIGAHKKEEKSGHRISSGRGCNGVEAGKGFEKIRETREKIVGHMGAAVYWFVLGKVYTTHCNFEESVFAAFSPTLKHSARPPAHQQPSKHGHGKGDAHSYAHTGDGRGARRHERSGGVEGADASGAAAFVTRVGGMVGEERAGARYVGDYDKPAG